MKNDLTLTELLAIFHNTVDNMGYGRALLSYYRSYGQMLLEYAERTGSDHFSIELAQNFLMECVGVSLYRTPGEKKHSTRKAMAIRMMRLLDDMNHQRPFMHRYPRKDKFPLPEQHEELIIKYKDYLRRYRGFTERSLYGVRNTLRSFLHYLYTERNCPLSELNESIVTDYIISLQHFHPVTIKGYCERIKPFLQYLHENRYIAYDISVVIPSIRVYRQAKIPSVWKKEDLTRMLDAIDRGSPGGKRDYAILLLASQIGLRATDIRSLKFSSLKWSNVKNKSKIEIIQSKTGTPISLPMLPDVGWALIDYIQNGRPQADSPFVFLRHNAPFEAFEPNNGLNNIIKKYAELAGINLNSEKKNGMHSLRHSFASNLVANHTPIETVSGLLGHKSTKSTNVYLKVDISNLRLCTLDPLEVIKVEG